MGAAAALRIAFLVQLVVWGATPRVALAQGAPAATPTLSVSGLGHAEGAPDLATFDAGVQSDAARAQEAIRRNGETMQAVLGALRALEIAPRDIQTRQLQLHPLYAQGSGGRRGRVTGYRATSRVQVRVREIADVGTVADALVEAGANDLGNIAFSVADPTPLLDRARAAAVANAQHKAALLARETGQRLGRLLEIRDAQSPARFPQPRGRLEGGFAAAQSLPIATGELSFRAEVNLVYALEPGAP